jgi:hypothetical protein
MAQKIEITEKQKQQFNIMLSTLHRIKAYDTTKYMRKNAEKYYGLDYEDVLEMAYENIQGEAKMGLKGIKPIK